MNKLIHIPFALLVLATTVMASPAEAQPVKLVGLLGDGCENYGNQVIVAATHVCSGGGDCENYGNQVVVLSSYDCDGSCPNHGVRVVVAGSMCGDDGTQACTGYKCFPPNPNALSTEAQTVAASPVDCLPYVKTGGGFPPSIQQGCDPSGQPCGINGNPVCWTSRYLCMNALVLVLNVYSNNVPNLMPQFQEPSSCEGQPGWGSGLAVAAQSSAATSDCIPKVSRGLSPGSIHVTCDPSGQPCGIGQQPICWTTRLLCMQSLSAALRAYGNVVQGEGSSCEGQPGWGDGGLLVAVRA
jgi:hypothetical protein